MGSFFGYSTNCLPHPLHKNFGVPTELLPFFTISAEKQCGQFILSPKNAPLYHFITRFLGLPAFRTFVEI
jgi:hypothetical protein